MFNVIFTTSSVCLNVSLSNCDQLCKATHFGKRMRKAGRDNEEKHRRLERKKGGRDENFVHDDLLHEWLVLVLRLGLVGFIFVSLSPPLILSTFSFLRCRSSWLRILIFPLVPEKDFFLLSRESNKEGGRRRKRKQ